MNKYPTWFPVSLVLLFSVAFFTGHATDRSLSLQIEWMAGLNVEVSWAGNYAGYVLEASDQLEPPLWRRVAGQPSLSGNRFSMVIPIDSQTRFFRLHSGASAFTVNARLESDTGISDSDGITSEAMMSGQVSDRGAIDTFMADFDAAASTNSFSMLDQVNPDGSFVFDAARLNTITGIPLADGPHELSLEARNAAGAILGGATVQFILDTTPPRIDLNPVDGQQDVLPRQLIVATFTEPVFVASQAGVGASTNLTDSLSLSAFGAAIPGRLVFDTIGNRLSLIPEIDLPGGVEFQISIDAGRFVDKAGNAAIGPSQPVSFRTANNQVIPGTALTGWVFDSTRSPDGGEAPLAGAKVSVANSPSTATVTDVNGRFILNNLPGGKLLIDVDGHSVKSPAGTFYPTVSKLFDAVSGRNTLIDVPIYLPLVPAAAFVTLSTNSVTDVSNPAQLPGWSLAVPPHTVERRDGALGQKMLISPVPPSRLPAPLPAGLSPKLVITIQTDGGADVFNQPVPLTAPNLEDLPPGAKTILWDFDHGRGIFVPVATATVSADGRTVTTDPGQGVVRPGWHFILNVLTDTYDLYSAKQPKRCPNETPDDYKKRLAEFKRRQLAMQLDTGALALNGASLIPGCGLVGGVAGAGASAWRDAVAGGSPAPSIAKDSLLGAGAADEFLTSRTADGYRKGIENLKSDKFAYAAKNLGRAGKFMKGALGVFAALSALDNYDKLQEDIDALKLSLKDPPGDFAGQALDGITRLQDALNDARKAIVQGLVEYLQGLIPIETVLIEYGGRSLDKPMPEPGQTRWIAAAADGAQHLSKAASALGPPIADKINRVVAMAKELNNLLLEPLSDRAYYSIASTAGGAATGTAFNQIVLTLPFGATGTITAVEPIHGLIGTQTIDIPETVTSGAFSLPAKPLYLYESDAPDLDDNGLPDDIDSVLGNPTRAQVVALKAGLGTDEAGLAVQGIIGRLTQRIQSGTNSYPGNSYNDMVAGDGVLYGIGGANAFEVIDISRPGSPVKMGRYRTGNGYRGFARGQRVAVTGAGLQVYDATDPRNPRLAQTFDSTVVGTDKVNPVLGANHVVVSKGKTLFSYDLDSGQQVSSVSLADYGSPVRMELNGDIIYVLGFEPLPNLQFSVATVRFDGSGKLAFLGGVRPFFWSTLGLQGPYGLAVDDRAAFVGPWLISADPFIPGFGTIDISDPSKPSVIAAPSTNIITGAAQVAADNSGHLLATVAGTAQNHLIQVFDVHDLKRTDNRVLTISLDDTPYAPCFTAGLAAFFTANDIYVARIVPPDSGSQSPVISKVALQGGTNVFEGRRFGVHVDVTDDAQVARVELLLQGDNVVATDATYPYDLDFLPPASLPDGQALVMTVRATDTGGNRTEKTYNLAYRARAPVVTTAIPAPGFTTKLNLTGASITVNKPLDRSIFSNDGFLLHGAGKDKIFGTADDLSFPIASATLNADNTQAILDFGGPLPIGRYQLTALANSLRDFGGNRLDGEFTGAFPSGDGQSGGDFTTGFEVLIPPEFAVDSFQFRGFRTDARLYPDLNTQSGGSPMLVVDVNDDGRPDIIRTVYDPRGGANDYQVVAVTLQNNDGSFADPITFPVAKYPIRVLDGDVDGDGKNDLVIVHYDTSYNGQQPVAQPFGLSLLSGNGDGTFKAPRTIDTGGRLLLTEGVFILGNFTGHGRADLAQLVPTVIQYDSNVQRTNRIAAELLLYPSAGGSLGAPVRTTLGTGTNFYAEEYRSMIAVDINRDGKLDLVAPDQGYVAQAHGLVMTSNGDGTFTTRSEPLFADLPGALVMADFTGDGRIDAISGTRFYRGLAGGGFELVGNEGLKANGVYNYSFSASIVADFDGDGRLDYATLTASPSFSYQTLGVFTNKADGTFGLMTTVRINQDALSRPATAVDLNGDGKPDILFDAGGGTSHPYCAYALFSAPGGGFPSIPYVEDINLSGLNELSLLADLNGDGIPDPVGYYPNAKPGLAMAVLPSQTGGFGPAKTNLIGATNLNFNVRAIGAGDFTGDGKIDVVVSRYDFSSSADGVVYLMAGNGDGTLQPGRLLNGPKCLIAVADFNGDGKPDLLAYDYAQPLGEVLLVYPGKGDGLLGAPIITRSAANFTFSGQVKLGDFNRDGKPDLLMASYGGGGLGIWLNDGAGHFNLASNNAGTIAKWELQGAGDFNRDGNLDVLMNDRTGNIGSYKLIVVPGDGAGNLGVPLAPTPFPGAYNSNAVVVDVNYDGTPDVVISGGGVNSLSEFRVSLGNGDGTFQPPISYFGGGQILAADFNGDGFIDLLADQTLLYQKPPKKP
jgi:hypothetical protein